MELTAHAGRSARFCEEAKGAAVAKTSAVVGRNLILKDGSDHTEHC